MFASRNEFHPLPLVGGVVLLLLAGYAIWLHAVSPDSKGGETTPAAANPGKKVSPAPRSREWGPGAEERSTHAGIEALEDRLRGSGEPTHIVSLPDPDEGRPSPLDLDFNLSLETRETFDLTDEQFARLGRVIEDLKALMASEERRVMWDESREDGAVTLHIPAWNENPGQLEATFAADLESIIGQEAALDFLEAAREALMLSSGYFGTNPRRYDIRVITTSSGNNSYVARVAAGENLTDDAMGENLQEALGPEGVIQTRHFADLPAHWEHLFQPPDATAGGDERVVEE